MTSKTSTVITICMGSSCFAHGNQQILERIQEFLTKNGKNAIVEVKGSLCQGKCKDGPSMMIDGKMHTRLTVEKALIILSEALLRGQE